MWLLLSAKDKTDVRTTDMRQFPFSTIVTDKDLHFKIYGAGLKTTAPKFAAAIAAAGTFAAGQSANAITESGSLSFGLEAAVYVNKAPETGATSSFMDFKFASTTWGGLCCATGTTCATCDYTSGNLKLFSTPGGTKIISHAYYDTSNDKHNAIT